MSAEVRLMFYTEETLAWTCRTRVEDAPGSRRLGTGRLDWQVVQRPIATTDGQAISQAKANI